MKSIESNNHSERLRVLLNSITRELDSTFLQRRAKSKSHKKDPIEELSDAINELNNREKDLQAAVGIALMLLDNEEALLLKIHKAKTKVAQEKEKLLHIEMENKALQDSLTAFSTKNEMLEKTIVQTEEALLLTHQELNRIVREKKINSAENISQYDIEDIKKGYIDQLETCAQQKTEILKENKAFKDRVKELEKEIDSEKDLCLKISENYSKTVEKLKDSESKLKILNEKLKFSKEKKQNTQNELKSLTSTHQRLKLYSERLEEELSINEIKKPAEMTHMHNQSSLHSELSILEHPEDSSLSGFQLEDSIEDIFFIKPSSFHINPSTRYTSLQSFSKFFTVSTSNHIKIYPKKSSRKEPPEEYFMLTAQVIKMNSSHMENICSVNSQALYQKANSENVPFHKWHEWIERQLNDAYIKSLFKKKTKNYWLKSTQKKQVILPS